MNVASKGELDPSHRDVFGMKEEDGTGMHRESGVLVVRDDLRVPVDVPVHAYGGLSRPFRSSGR